MNGCAVEQTSESYKRALRLKRAFIEAHGSVTPSSLKLSLTATQLSATRRCVGCGTRAWRWAVPMMMASDLLPLSSRCRNQCWRQLMQRNSRSREPLSVWCRQALYPWIIWYRNIIHFCNLKFSSNSLLSISYYFRLFYDTVLEIQCCLTCVCFVVAMPVMPSTPVLI